MTLDQKLLHRRSFLRGCAGSALGASLFGTAAPVFQARAADVSGYKALVCIFFLGGLDNHDTLIPYDQASYDAYGEIRSSLLSFYNDAPGGSTRLRDQLLPLNPANAADYGGRQFALPPQLANLHNLFETGEAAILPNVGPLIQPLTRAEWEAENVPTPARLFSHNDQQSTWMSSNPEGAQFGWGGRFGDAALASNANFLPDFTAITTLGNELFLTGEVTRPYQIGLNGADEVFYLDIFESLRSGPGGEQLYQDFRAHLTASDFQSANLIERDVKAALANSLLLNEQFNEARASLSPFAVAFPPTDLGGQLNAIAETISLQSEFQANRQIFFAAIGGFDTHSNQANDLPALQSEIDGAVAAFVAAMQEIGAYNDVTLFSAADFGRTLAINGDGTDHGWGATQFVVGGGVNGGVLYGDVPPAAFEHDYDAGGGRLIPNVSVEQFAEPLGRWFGLNDGELAAALPNLANFSGEAPVAFL
ncbi:MAG: DUF1501 domain-containing protein [Pseudomonadota bacterium]